MMSQFAPTRRRLLAGGTVLPGLFFARPLLAAIPQEDVETVFEIRRNGSKIGTHKVVKHPVGRDLYVSIDIDINVGLGPFSFFRYQHTNRESWREGRLMALTARTYDDGDNYFVNGVATEDGFRVDSTSGTVVAPADILPTSYWNPGTVEARQLLNTQKGDLLDVEVKKIGEETVPVAGQSVACDRYRLISQITADIWYTAEERQWAAMALEARGAEISYRRQSPTPSP